MIYLALLLSFIQFAHAGTESIQSFRLSTCLDQGKCIKVDSKESKRSPLDASYVFLDADVKIFSQEKKGGFILENSYQARSGYFDPSLGYIILRAKKEGSFHKDLILDLNQKKLTWIEGS